MADRFYAKDPVPVRDNKKLFVGIAVVIVLFLCMQIGLRMFSGKSKIDLGQNLVQDTERTVYREKDVVKGLQLFGKGARESALSKLREKNKSRISQEPETTKERLGPIQIIRHEKPALQNIDSLVKEQKPLGIPLGTQVIALMRTKIFSFNTENHVEAEVIKDVQYLGKMRVPKGSKFFGTVSILHSEDRVNIRFHRLLLPWGEERHVSAVAHSLDGSGGLRGKVNRHWFKRTFSIFGKTVLSGLTLFTVPNRQEAFSARDQLQLTAASNLAQEGQRELGNLKVEKSITVPGGIVVKVIFLESA